MVQFLSIIFFLGFLQFLLGFSKVPFFCVTLYYNNIPPAPHHDILHNASQLTSNLSVTLRSEVIAEYNVLWLVDTIHSWTCQNIRGSTMMSVIITYLSSVCSYR